jgi:nucleoside 2-deoxyribosyltransferase
MSDPRITDEAVQRALDVFVEHRVNTKESRMRAALEAALPHMTPALPTREQIAEVLWKYRQRSFPQAADWEDVHSASRTAMLERADAVLALINGSAS